MLFISSLAVHGQTTNVIGTVDQQTIETAEVKREMLRSQAAVMNIFIKTHQLTDLKNFWKKDFNGISPIDELRKTALENLVKIKVQESLFKNNDLWPYFNHQALIDDMTAVNNIRKKMVEDGKVIYGPIVFSDLTFFDYQFSNAIIKTKDKLKKTLFNVSDSTLLLHLDKMKKGVFANNKESFEELKSRIETSYIDEKYQELVAAKITAAKVKINHSLLKEIHLY
ncbi:MAG: hypothetical protein REI64_13835 [Pedobacter sp.]|uniref:hypothetical protein n=1 Tax=Pedobacter sp. TaxID=1411316 RepID=UPI0028088D55|nr:hypothetical protein [Pedobacter sp.]MDQ8005878.1 hypothetical protein [Pedobacter sp.]